MGLYNTTYGVKGRVIVLFVSLFILIISATAGASAGPSAGPDAASSKFVTVKDGHLYFGDSRLFIRGINYYPKGKVWNDFWSGFDAAEVRRDFGTIRSMGFNCVRVFLQYDSFGRENLDNSSATKLSMLLSAAADEGLRVIVTLFDRIDPRTFYSSWNFPKIEKHLESLVPLFSNDSAILCWDLKNEPDLDYRFNLNSGVVNDCISRMIAKVRSLDSNHLITVGYLNPPPGQATAGCDILSFHFYAAAEKFPAAMDSAKFIAKGRPVLLEEFGFTTSGIRSLRSPANEVQEYYFSSVLASVLGGDIDGFLIWTLYDHPRETEIEERERHFGMIGLNGSVKPASKLVSRKMIITRDPVRIAVYNDNEAGMSLEVLDISGNSVRTLAGAKKFSAGGHIFYWDLRDNDGRMVPRGEYLVMMRSGDTSVSERISVSAKDMRAAVFTISALILLALSAYLLPYAKHLAGHGKRRRK